MKKFLYYILAIALPLTGCETNEPKNDAQLSLQVEETSCTEAWLKIEYAPGGNISLQRDGAEITNFTLTGNDTTIIDESLEPSQTYKYTAISNISGIQKSASSSAITLDTTSHEFEWDVKTFGVSSTSVFTDVSVINDNDIWAVGGYFQADSTGQEDPTLYGAAHWNGNEWEIKNIKTYYSNQPAFSLEFNGIISFSSNVIWLISMDGVFLYNSQNIYRNYWLRISYSEGVPIFEDNQQLFKIWGFSSSDLYVGGYHGALAHFDGTTWVKIETGTDALITWIWGYYDEKTHSRNVFYLTDESKLYKLNGLIPELYEDFSPQFYANSFWMLDGKRMFILGSENLVGTKGNWKEIKDLPPLYKKRMAGNGMNDLFILDGYGNINHFNGVSWKTMSVTGMEERFLFSLSVKGNTVAVVGMHNDDAIVAIGRRK